MQDLRECVGHGGSLGRAPGRVQPVLLIMTDYEINNRSPSSYCAVPGNPAPTKALEVPGLCLSLAAGQGTFDAVAVIVTPLTPH